MSSLQKLSNIGTEHIDTISSVNGEPEWLLQSRHDSLAIYDKLPIETSPLYTKYTDAKRMNPEYVLLSDTNSSSSSNNDDNILTPQFLNRRLEELQNEISIIQIGTITTRIHVPSEIKEKGVILDSIYGALKNAKTESIVRSAIESSDSAGDKFTALNNAAFNSGLFLHVPRNVILEQPIHLLVCLPSDGTSVISRNVISIDENAKASVVQEMYSDDGAAATATTVAATADSDDANAPKGANQSAYLELLNTFARENSHLDVTTLQMLDQRSSINFSTRRTTLAADSQVNWYSGLFGSILSRYRIEYFLQGSGASANDSEVVFGNAEQSFDIQTDVNHESPATEGRVVEKSILRDKSRSLFKGMIRIKENATKSNSFLSGRSILLDKDAKSDAIPGLEIFTNDVKATHSASVAQIDEEQIFYLKSRCLSQQEAERTIVEGFLEPLSRKMSYQVRAWIAYLIESKWEGRELGINTDEELTKFVEVEETRYNEDAEIEQHYKYR